jgi:sugar-specific transcriptional regulator TrmB
MRGVREDLLSVLESLGLTRLEAQIYFNLLVRGEAEAKEMVQTFNIYFPQFYGLVSNLERKGFIEVQQGRPKRYRAVDQKEIARRKMREMETGVEVLTKSIEDAREKAETPRRPSVWITSGVQNILYNVNAIIKSARLEATMVIESRFIPDVAHTLVKKASEGVQVYLITYPREPGPDLMKRVKKVGRIRTFDTCPFAILAVADCERALMAHGLLEAAPPERQYGVVFHEPLTPIFFSENFYELWKRARPLIQEAGPKLPAAFRSQRMALIEIKNLLKKGDVIAKVRGRFVRTGEIVEKKGVVAGLTDNEAHKNFSIRLQDGKVLTVGGFYSTLEDIEAELVTISEVTSRKRGSK